MNNALENYKLLKAGIQDCSLSCSPKQPSNKGSIDTIKEQAMCIHKCEEEKFGKPESLFRVSDEVKQNFKSMKPYQYLQYAYFKNGELAKSVAATFTYASYDPENKMMRDNLEYYQKHENVTDDMFVNLEPISFIDDYDHGIQAYNHEDYKEAVAFFEKALSKYYQVENECRAHCEMEFDPGSEYKDEATNFHRQITDHYRSVLECYMKCPNEAARVNNESYVRNFVPKIY
uniref:Leprecan-like alpha-helical domain-containing protein n=1 Tax=Ciona savignyi TaxID=51511 RepID=H2ZBL8_CIOSA